MGTVILFGVAVPVIELVIGIIGLVVILGMAVGSTWFAFIGYPKLHAAALERRYPVVVPGWKTRLSEHPPFNATVEDFAKMNEIMVKCGVEVKGYKKKDCVQKVNNLMWKFHLFDANIEKLSGGKARRHVEHPTGQKRADGTPVWVAGWHDGDFVHLVYRPEDTLGNLAGCHEIGHEFHELEGTTDYQHRDLAMWGGKVKDGADYAPYGPFGDVGTVVKGVVSEAKAGLRAYLKDKDT